MGYPFRITHQDRGNAQTKIFSQVPGKKFFKYDAASKRTAHYF